MIQAIIFDCFGVLAEDGWTPFKRKYIEDKPDVALAVQLLGKEVDSGTRNFDDMIRETAKLADVPESVVRTAVWHQVPNEDLFAYIKTLKPDYKIGALSNASYNIINELFTLEQAALFDATVLSYEAGVVKPDRRAYQLICKRLDVLPEEAIFVDDNPRHCAGAEAVGMATILYQDVSQTRTEIEAILKKQPPQ